MVWREETDGDTGLSERSDLAHAADAPVRSRRKENPRRPVAVIIDGHVAFADLVAGMMAGPFEVDVAATAATVAAGRTACVASRPDLVVLNPSLPDGCGLALLATLAVSSPVPRVILVADRESLPRIRQRQPLASDPVQAVVGIEDGAPGLAGAITGALETLGRESARQRIERTLSQREMDVFRRIGQGLSTATIATELGISRQTVETHRKSITKKLGATGAGLVRLAVLHGTPLERQTPRVP